MRLLPLPGVFKPPSDAWMLASHFTTQRLAAGRRVLDLCTGSGVLAISAGLAGASEVTAVDISRRAVAAVKLNAWLNGVRVEARRGDLFAAVTGRRFDLIIANPPYLPGDTAGLPRHGLARATEGGRSGRVFIERIARQAGHHMTDHGDLLLVHSTVCGEPQTLELLRSSGLTAAVVARHRGPLGPRLRTRAGWLRKQGLLLAGDEEEILIVRATRSDVPAPAEASLPSAV